MSENWINAVVIICVPTDQDSGPGEQLATDFAQQFADNPGLLVSISVDDQQLRAKIQEPVDLDLAASEQRRDQAALACAEQFAYDSDYYWEEVNQRGELVQQGNKHAFVAEKQQ